MNTNKTIAGQEKQIEAKAAKNATTSTEDKIKARLDEQRKLNESGSCCGACGG